MFKEKLSLVGVWMKVPYCYYWNYYYYYYWCVAGHQWWWRWHWLSLDCRMKTLLIWSAS